MSAGAASSFAPMVALARDVEVLLGAEVRLGAVRDGLALVHSDAGEIVEVEMACAEIRAGSRAVTVSMPMAPLCALRYWLSSDDASLFPDLHILADASDAAGGRGVAERYLWRFAAMRCAFLLRPDAAGSEDAGE